ncbi:MAG: type II toxin-antitoxin system prevent-host-death family antitoxin [bacterium]
MNEIGVYEAKTHLPKLLERVSKGENFIITKHGVPIARLVPAENAQKRPVAEVIRELLDSRKRRKASLREIKDMKEEGRR